jgi:hypothetical protein
LSGTGRSNLLRAIELLGKTVGAFVDKVEIQEVKAADALDQLIEMAKSANTPDTGDDPKGTDMLGTESFEPVGLLDRPSVPERSE